MQHGGNELKVHLPPLGTPAWTQDQEIAFQCAQDYMGELTALYRHALDQLQLAGHESSVEAQGLEASLKEIKEARQSLSVTDDVQVSLARQKYAQALRDWRNVSDSKGGE